MIGSGHGLMQIGLMGQIFKMHGSEIGKLHAFASVAPDKSATAAINASTVFIVIPFFFPVSLGSATAFIDRRTRA
jgi:hypothetical protein